MIELAFWFCVAVVTYVYLGYPILLRLLPSRPLQVGGANPSLPSVTVLIPAYNEERVIEGKIRNTQDLRYGSSLETIVASDGSTDRTVALVRDRMPDAILMESATRRGKTAVVNEAVERASGDIVVFTDANVLLAPDCIAEIVAPFSDPTVGCVQGQLTYTNVDDSPTAENGGLQWRYEEYLKREESRTGSVMGADGSIFAIRRALFSSLPDYVLDDFSTSMRILGRGYRIVFARTARASERSAATPEEEFRRKIRISTRAVRSFMEVVPFLFRLSYLDWVKLVSHKLLRWGTGIFLVGALLGNIALVVLGEPRSVYGFMLLGQVVFYAIGGGALVVEIAFGRSLRIRPLAAVGYFLLSVYATTIGAVQALAGVTVPYWSQTETTR